MDRGKIVNFDPSDKLIIGKPAGGVPAEISNRIEKSLCGSGLVKEAFFPQYFVLGKMPVPKMILVLVPRETSNPEELAVLVNRMQEAGEWGDTITDIWVMNSNDPLLPAVRRAKCDLNLN
jgi:hypothetical protein